LAGVSSDSKGLVAGLAIGDTSQLSAETSDVMKVVSLTHLTAVSGANCAIVIGSVYLFLGRLPISRWFRLAIAFGVLVLYVLTVGPQPSVMRAAVMATILMIGVGLGRRGAAAQALALCVLILLIADPWLATNYGFQLSVLATVGILQLSPAIAIRLQRFMPPWLAIAVSVASAAQLLCLPVLLELQPGLSTYSVPANLIAEPIVAPITVLGMIAFAVAPALPWLTAVLTWIASLGAWCIIKVATIFADSPSATVGWPSGAAGILSALALVAAVFAWFRTKRQAIRVIAALITASFCAVSLGSCTAQQVRGLNWPPADWEVVSCDVGQGDATVIRSHGQIAVIDVGRKPAPVRNCLNKLKVSRIDLLVLTHFDLDHVGGLDGALSGRSVGAAMITSYSDSRPAAGITWRKLMKHSESLTQAEKGMTGDLGEFRWQVLSPHRGAPEAEDSNDGSVTILFESQHMDVLTLADLGEKGQMRLAAESAGWLGTGFGSVPLVVKVSHHGSADQYPEFYEALHPNVALFSVGLGNDYGHPTKRTLDLLASTGAKIFRTDLQGGVAVSSGAVGLRVSTSGHG
jgi:competence protein ComEC